MFMKLSLDNDTPQWGGGGGVRAKNILDFK